MSNKAFLLGSICAAALAVACPALADDTGSMQGMGGISGTLSGDYANIDSQSGGGSGNVWGGSAEGATALGGSNVSIQVDGGYHRVSASGADADLWNFDGSLYTLINKGGRLGATVGYNNVSGGGLSGHVTNYGLFGEWWASDMLTVGGKAGGFDGSGVNGYYGSGMIKGYYMPDFSLAGSIDYTHANNGGDATAYTASAEYLVSETTPISIGGGYTYTNLAGSHYNTWFLQLKFYCNGDSGASTLVDRQRSSGTLGNDVGFGSLLVKF